jgi:hypothetical protein
LSNEHTFDRERNLTMSTPKPGKPIERLTETWPDSKGKDIKPKATVTFDGKTWTVKGRFTAHKKAGLVPSVALVAKGHKAGNRHAPASEVTLTK